MIINNLLFLFFAIKNTLLEKKSMPKAYSDDLRLRAVWLHVFLGYKIEDTSSMLAMSPISVKRFKKICAHRWSCGQENWKTFGSGRNVPAWGARDDGSYARAPREDTDWDCKRNYDCIRKPFSSVDGLPILSKKRRYKKMGKQLSAGLLKTF